MAMIRAGISVYRRALLRDGRAPARRTAGFFDPLDLPAATFGRGVAGRGDGVRRVELRVSVREDAERFEAGFERDAAGFREAAAAGFLRDTGRAVVRRCFTVFFGSFIVSSIFTSCFVSSRQTPGVSFGSEMGPMATRRSFETGWPTA